MTDAVIVIYCCHLFGPWRPGRVDGGRVLGCRNCLFGGPQFACGAIVGGDVLLEFGVG